MKRFLQWFIALLQILFGLCFAAAVALFVLGRFEIAKLADGGILKYVVCAFAALFLVLSAAVMAIALAQYSKVDAVVTADGEGSSASISAGKIRKVLKKAAESVTGVKLKTFIISANTEGYVLTAKINVLYRNAQDAAAEFKGVAAKLYEEIYGRIFKDIAIVIGKVKEKVDAAEIAQEVKTELELGAASTAEETEPEQSESNFEAQYFAPPTEDEPPVVETVAEPVKEPVKEPIKFVPEPEKKAEPIIKIETAKTPKAAPKAKAGVPAAAAKPKKQTIDPNDPPPFKL